MLHSVDDLWWGYSGFSLYGMWSPGCAEKQQWNSANSFHIAASVTWNSPPNCSAFALRLQKSVLVHLENPPLPAGLLPVIIILKGTILTPVFSLLGCLISSALCYATCM